MTVDALIAEHAPFVRAIAASIAARIPPHVDREDLVAAGMVGLWRAASRYAPSRGPFKSFAVKIIRGAIIDDLRETDHLSRQARRHTTAALAPVPALTQRLGRRPSLLELAAASGISERECWTLLANGFVKNGFAFRAGEQEHGIEHIFGGGDHADAACARVTLEALMARLLPSERQVFLARTVLGLTLREAGALTGTSESNAYQTWRRAIGRLARLLGASPLRLRAAIARALDLPSRAGTIKLSSRRRSLMPPSVAP